MYRFRDYKVLTLLSVNAIIFVILLITLEISARIFYPQIMPLGNESRKFWEYDSLLGWSHKPNVKDIQTIANSTINISINSKKLRDSDYEYERNTKNRVLVLGDSFAWGFGVNKNERFSEIVERSFESLEIINSAVPGYSTDQQLLYYIYEGYKYNSDFVLLLFCENDFLGNSLNQIHWYNKPVYTYANGNLKLNSVPVPKQSFYQSLREFLSGKSYLISFILKRLTLFNAQSFSFSEFSFSNSATITEKLVEKLNNECNENGSKLLIANIPMDKEKVQFLTKVSKDNSINYLDLSPLFKDETNYLIPDDGHWNAKGNLIAGKRIINWFRQLGILSTNIVAADSNR